MGPTREAVATAILFIKGKFHYKGYVEYVDATTGERIRIDGPFFNVICTNVSHLATDAHVAPAAQPDDGVIHLCIYKACSRVMALRTFIAAETASHLRFDHVHTYKATHVKIVPTDQNDGGYCACDGDIVPYGTAEVSLLPGHTNVVISTA